MLGSTRALLGEYKKAIDELIRVIEPLSNSQLSSVADKDTTDSECKSIQTVLTHIVSSGYSYTVYIENSNGINSVRPVKKTFNSVNQYIEQLNAMFEYCEYFFKKFPDLEIEQTDNLNKINTKWGQWYDIEQLLEHAIVHVLRHRRQIENFILILQ